MSLSIYEITAPTMIGGLNTLKTILKKAAAHADAKKFDSSVLSESRLYPDMYNLRQQVYAATDLAQRGLDRLAGREPGSIPDVEKTIPELLSRVENTIQFAKSLNESSFDGAESLAITIDVGEKLQFNGRSYVLSFLLPNFYFHLTTAYAILRHNGVELGKREYVGPFLEVSA